LNYVILLPSLARCVDGVRHRVDHGFTDEEATRKMYDEFAKASIDDRHVLRDPPEGVDAVADQIMGELEKGQLSYVIGQR
jgi:hypothetical protein